MMRWLDALLGRTRPAKSSFENLFSISTARITLAVKFNVKPTGKAGITFKPVGTSYFDAAERELKGLLELAEGETKAQFRLVKDGYGYGWVLLLGKGFEDLVATLHMTSGTLRDHGFGDQLLAAVFQFADDEGRPIYWIYNYKRGRFYPFVPQTGKERDNALELRLRALMEKEMPLEPELDRWYPLWDIPLSRE